MKVKINFEITFGIEIDNDIEVDTAQAIQLLILLATVASLFI